MPSVKLLTAATAATLALAPTAAAQAPAGGAAFVPNALSVSAGALAGETITVRGELPRAAGERVRVERFDAETGAWKAVAWDEADADGRFAARWKALAVGRHTIRAVPDRQAASSARSTDPDAPTGSTTVYRRAGATWYGPGFWGRSTACGDTLEPELMGVAHKTLPCGTKVTLFYQGRAVTVTVIDRGPYADGVAWDLTKAASDELGMTEAGRVTLGALPEAPPAAGRQR
ncbi:MAG TPA: septal ring lytic transglycosylase RlpA family protein [Capillimicrobium sp.]|jgi:rare lipoprotein A (peptidoglycan hydrolase)